MQMVMPIILIIMIAMVVFTFRSAGQTAAVFLLIPFGLIGVGLGHFVHGNQISLFSWLGMIALIGILINDALVFVAAFNNNLKSGMEFKDALYEAGLSRFRPIVLTSITTIAGLAPLILDGSFQAQFLIPMAITVAYGLLIVTVIILILLPVYLLALNSMRRAYLSFMTGKDVSPTESEPAVRELKSLQNNGSDH